MYYNKCIPLVKLSENRAKDKKWFTKGQKLVLDIKSLFKNSLFNPSEGNKLRYKIYKTKLRN